VRALVVALLILSGCPKRRDDVQTVDPSLVVVSPKQALRTDPVGDEGRTATFVLIDADNHAKDELMVVLRGDLLDAHGAVVGHLRHDALRVPAGGRRTFALIADPIAPVPAATRAQVEVERAYLPSGPAPMRITDGHVYDNQGRAVVAGYLVNDSKNAGKAMVIAGFYDANGTPMTRPWTLYDIGGGEKRAAQFVGPPGSKSAYIFVGETVY
jgi:hypothetical protein